MLMLKGSHGKSRVMEILMDKTNSICFIYNDYPVIYNTLNGFYVDSKECSLERFIEFISKELKHAAINDRHYDYMLVYTNENEENLHEVIDWLNKYQLRFPCRDIILACK